MKKKDPRAVSSNLMNIGSIYFKLSKFINIEEPHLDTKWDRGRGNLHTFGGTDNGNPVPQLKDEVIRERELVEVEPHIFNTIFKNHTDFREDWNVINNPPSVILQNYMEFMNDEQKNKVIERVFKRYGID